MFFFFLERPTLLQFRQEPVTILALHYRYHCNYHDTVQSTCSRVPPNRNELQYTPITINSAPLNFEAISLRHMKLYYRPTKSRWLLPVIRQPQQYL